MTFIGICLLVVMWIVYSTIAYIFLSDQNRYLPVGAGLLLTVISLGVLPLILNLFELPISGELILVALAVGDLLIAAILFLFTNIFAKRVQARIISLRALTANKAEIATLVILALFFISIPLLLHNQDSVGYTEFYFLANDYNSSPWRQTYAPADSVPLNYVVANEEVQPADYSLVVLVDNRIINSSNLGTITPGEKRQETVILPPLGEVEAQYKFLLYKDGVTLPYRSLSLWIKRAGQ